MWRKNPYAETGLDRMAPRRGDDAFVRALLEAAETLIVPVWRGHNLVTAEDEPRAGALPAVEAADLLANGAEPIFLGVRGGAAHFSVDLSHLDEPHALPPLHGRGDFRQLRDVGPFMPMEEGGLLAYARGLAHWHRSHRFCGRCGAPTEMREAGHMRRCSNPECGASHFPRTDPAVIVVVSRGERALLGHKRGWAEGRYSALAGFVEPGETLEGAVAREVMEETGVRVGEVRYHSSQPWPFPASLMVGFFATALDDEIRIDDDELADARWFTREELIRGEAGFRLSYPPSDSIARRLIREWIEAGA